MASFSSIARAQSCADSRFTPSKQRRSYPALFGALGNQPSLFATLEGVGWFNNRRLLEPIGNISPTEAKERSASHWQNRRYRRDSNKMASGKPERFASA